MFGYKPKTFYWWYRNFLSGYNEDVGQGLWGGNNIYIADKETGEILEERPVYVAKPENMGACMTVDDKQIGTDMFTIMTNQETGKIALLVETLKVAELEMAIIFLGNSTNKVENISCDMSASYLKFIKIAFPQSTIIIDKFHVVKNVLDALQSVRLRLKKELMAGLDKGNKKTKKDKQILSDLELLSRCKYLLNKKSDDWNNYQQEMVRELFEKFSELQTAFHITKYFREWYDKGNCKKLRILIQQELLDWYAKVKESTLEEFASVVKMVAKHEENILNYFQNAITNARAENMNSKIQRFVINNFGLRDKDFALYRIAKYFS